MKMFIRKREWTIVNEKEEKKLMKNIKRVIMSAAAFALTLIMAVAPVSIGRANTLRRATLYLIGDSGSSTVYMNGVDLFADGSAGVYTQVGETVVIECVVSTGIEPYIMVLDLGTGEMLELTEVEEGPDGYPGYSFTIENSVNVYVNFEGGPVYGTIVNGEIELYTTMEEVESAAARNTTAAEEETTAVATTEAETTAAVTEAATTTAETTAASTTAATTEASTTAATTAATTEASTTAATTEASIAAAGAEDTEEAEDVMEAEDTEETEDLGEESLEDSVAETDEEEMSSEEGTDSAGEDTGEESGGSVPVAAVTGIVIVVAAVGIGAGIAKKKGLLVLISKMIGKHF